MFSLHVHACEMFLKPCDSSIKIGYNNLVVIIPQIQCAGSLSRTLIVEIQIQMYIHCNNIYIHVPGI